MNLKYMRVYFVLSLFLLTSIFFSTISARASTTNLVENEFTAEFSPLVGNPDEAGNMYDETNRSNIRTGFNTWEEDWGEGEVPKGIYVGTAFAPAVLDTGIQRVYRRCVFEVGFTANFSAKEIMNGASSFWVKIPVVYDAELFNFTFSRRPHYLEDVQSFIDGVLVHSPQTVIVGFSIYVYFHYIIQPYTDYDFMFRLPLNYWSTSLIPSNGYYDPNISPRILLTGEKVCPDDGSYYSILTINVSAGGVGATTWLTNSSYDDFDGVSFTPIPSSISLGFSFLFTNGIGLGGLFGRSYNIQPYSSSYDTRFEMAVIISHNNVKAYPSIIVPFHSIDSVFLANAKLLIRNTSHAGFGLAGLNDIGHYTVSNSYDGMFIFSFGNLTLHSPPNEGIPAILYLNVRNSVDSIGAISFLHNSNISNSATTYVSSYVEGASLYNFYGFGGFSWYSEVENVSFSQFIYYDFVCYAEMKSGQWTWIWHNATGVVQYDYVFRQKIYVPVTIYNITNGATGETIYVGTNGFLYNSWIKVFEKEDSGGSDDDWLTKMFKGIKRGIQFLYNGMNKMYGYIIDGIQALGEALYRLGEIVVTSLMKFWGVLESIVAFIEDNILNILELLVTTASAFLFLLIMPVVSKSFKSFFTYVGGNV